MNKDYRGLPKTERKNILAAQYYDAAVEKVRRWMVSIIIINAVMSILNLILFVFVGGHWYSLAAAIFTGCVAIWSANKLKNKDY